MASKKVGAPRPTPVLVIAGLPKATALAAEGTVNKRNGRWRAIASTFPENDAAFYDASALLDLVRRVCAFARDQAKDREGVPVPSRLLLAYVQAPDAPRVFEGFGHSAWPIALRDEAPDEGEPDAPRHWRHNIETVNQRVAEVLKQAESASVEGLRQRLEARRTDEVLLLPGRNFHTGDADRLVSRFQDFMCGATTVDDVAEGINIQRYAFSRLEIFYRETGGSNKRFARDARGLVFARSERGQHGAHHDVLPADADLSLLRRTLEGRFRFGTPIQPEGFQHDVQWEKGRPLRDVEFDCAQDGPIRVNASHANVYPNDVVKVRGEG
jgi:hypothetical protein